MRNSTLAVIVVAWAAILVAVYFVYFTVPAAPQGKYDSLAKCLNASGVVMYGQQGCHACESQKALLGSSFQFINEVDCLQQRQSCDEQKIMFTPTWLINGSLAIGVQQPSQLANLSGCVL